VNKQNIKLGMRVTRGPDWWSVTGAQHGEIGDDEEKPLVGTVVGFRRKDSAQHVVRKHTKRLTKAKLLPIKKQLHSLVVWGMAEEEEGEGEGGGEGGSGDDDDEEDKKVTAKKQAASTRSKKPEEKKVFLGDGEEHIGVYSFGLNNEFQLSVDNYGAIQEAGGGSAFAKAMETVGEVSGAINRLIIDSLDEVSGAINRL
jgi:hypothetical protein